MFGFVTANMEELTKEQKTRYQAVYCGICRRIRIQSSQLSRVVLNYDMAFLALLLMSLYEPEEMTGNNRCAMHPVKKHPWLDNEYIRYAADMNVALAYYNFLDDWQDDGKRSAKWMANILGKRQDPILERYPRQCKAIENCITELSRLEKENCENPDLPANCFGALMGELLVYQEDLWAPTLRTMGDALGRFIYLTDAAMDYDQDEKKGCYNPFLASGGGRQPQLWKKYQLMAMGRCADAFERLPLVQDKALLDNILYSGVWLHQGKKRKEGSA